MTPARLDQTGVGALGAMGFNPGWLHAPLWLVGAIWALVGGR